MKKAIAPGIFSDNYSGSELENFLLNKQGRKMGLALDLDGTIHRGMLPRSFYESSNADLAFCLLPAVAKKSLLALIEYFLVGFSLTSKAIEYGLGIIRQNPEEQVLEMITEFSERILAGLSYDDFFETAQHITKFAYKDSLECILQLSQNYEKTMLISMSFKPVLEAYADKLIRMSGGRIKIEAYGTNLLVRNDEIFGLYTGVLNSEEKAKALIQNASGLERCAIFGNSDNDIEMFTTGSRVFGSSNCLKVSINKSPPELIEISDIYFRNWNSLKNFLSSSE